MPKSDTWPGDVAVETVGGMDSAGSCDSVVSIHSGFSDASLEQLTVEERECIIFLEETIESLEADEGRDPANDEPEPQLTAGSLATKIASLSASLSGSISRHQHDGPKGEVGPDHRSLQGCLVPTPLVMAKSSQPSDEPDMAPPCLLSGQFSSGPEEDAVAAERKTGCQDRPKTGSSRGPLSYGGLMELRLKPSLKKHSQSFTSGTKEGSKLSPTDLSQGSQSNRSSDSPSQRPLLHQTPKPKATPPMVAPKPKKLPLSVAVATQKAPVPSAESRRNWLGTSPSERVVMDPQRVRMEALHKLGLLPDGGAAPPPCTRTLPSATGRPRSRSDLPAVPSARPPQPAAAKSVTLERSGVTLDCCSDGQASLATKPRPRSRTTSLGHWKAAHPDAAAEPTSHKPLFPNGISAVMAPWNQSGQVRQEALRKLGLLRE